MPSMRATGLSVLCALMLSACANDATRTSAGPSPERASVAAAPAATASPAEVDAQLRSLHDQLGLTPAQERQWNVLSRELQDTSRKMRDMEQSQSASTKDVVQAMRAHENMLHARMDAMQTIMPSAEKLYSEMTPQQRNRWNNVMLSSQVGGCGLLCRVGLGEGV
jgi:periplasmic protein CpxP/Spy